MTRLHTAASLIVLLSLTMPLGLAGEPALQTIGTVRIPLFGLSATVDPPNPVIPTNRVGFLRITLETTNGVRLGPGGALHLGPGFQIRAELSGPGLPAPLTLPLDVPSPTGSLELKLPALPIAGDYELSNVRIVSPGHATLDVAPQHMTVRVVEPALAAATAQPRSAGESDAKKVGAEGSPSLRPAPMKAAGVTSATHYDPLWVPGNNLQLWLRADLGVSSGGGAFWADQSGRGHHATQPSPLAAPTLVQNAANGLPAMRFDGQDDFVLLGSRFDRTIRTAFWVTRDGGGATFGSEVEGHHGGGAPGTIWHQVSPQILDGQVRVNGAAVDGLIARRPRLLSVISLVTTSGLSADRFGTSPGGGYRPWWGDLAELIIYDRALTAIEVQAVERYLGARYGISIQ